MDWTQLKIAIVNDQMYSLGGGDRLLESVWKSFPNADVFTLFINHKKYPQFKNHITSIVPDNSFFRALYKNPITSWFFTRTLNVMAPVLYESIDLTSYDVVITLSARSAKGVITGLNTFQISIINTPPRFEWDKDESIRDNKVGFGLGMLSNFISTLYRIWDKQVADRADTVIAVSNFIAAKIKKYYRKDAYVLYPAIGDFWLLKNSELPEIKENDYFYLQSRLFDSKRIDIAIRGAIKAKVKLVIVGEGPELKHLKQVAGKELNKSIFFKGFLPDELSKAYYTKANAFIFPAVEDFGIVPIESLSCGTPVIAYNGGGVKETMVSGRHGFLFDNEEELVKILQSFKKEKFNKEELKEQARKFAEHIFIEKLQQFVETKYGEFKKH